MALSRYLFAWWACSLWILAMVSPSPAATVVTACGTPAAAGGMNLANALAIGGEIIIRCADGSGLIKFSGRLIMRRPVSIDGEGRLTLVGSGNGEMFGLDGPLTLTLRGLTIRNPVPAPTPPNAYTSIVYDPADDRSVELYNVNVTDTLLPFVVRRLIAVDSNFSGNGDRSVPDAGVVMAGDLTLKNSTFANNLSRPFAAVWRGDPRTNGRKITGQIYDSHFTGNARPAFWAIGDLFIQNSRFESNGANGGFVPGQTGQLYSGAVSLDLTPSLSGALDNNRGRVVIFNSQFAGNNGFTAGAVASVMGRLTVRSTVFEGNAAQNGGGISFLSIEATENGLSLDHVTFRKNRAARGGGGLYVQGNVAGDAVLFTQNSAGEAGGAIVVARAGVASALPTTASALLPPTPAGFRTQATFSRAVFVDNSAKSGSAVDASGADLRLGDGLIIRNHTAVSASGAVVGADIELAATTIAQNEGGGLATMGPAQIRIGNTIFAGNTGANCRVPPDRLQAFGPNLQFPGGDCGQQPLKADPGLNARFEPSQFGSAGRSGSTAICSGHDLVQGRDVYGKDRQGSRCAIGAVEPDIERQLRDLLPFEIRADALRLFRLLVLFMAACLLVGLFFGLFPRHKRM